MFIKVPYTIMAPTREDLMFTPCGTTISRLSGVSADSVWAYACDQGETWINDPAKIAATHVIEFSLVIPVIPGVGEMEHWTSPVEGTYLLQLPGLSRARRDRSFRGLRRSSKASGRAVMKDHHVGRNRARVRSEEKKLW